MSSFTVNDLAPDFTATLTTTDTKGVVTPANLTGATIQVHFTLPSLAVLSVIAVPVSATAGTIAHPWTVGQLSEAGQWFWEAQVTFVGGIIQTFPGAPFYVAPEIA